MLESVRVVTLLFVVWVVAGRFVAHKKEKAQAQIDKEVLLEDEDYEEEDVLNLTSEEQKERLRKLVEKKIDVDQDGFVDTDELQRWSLKAFDTFESDDVTEEFPIMDTDKDGHVTWKEFSDDVYGDDFTEDGTAPKTLLQYKKEKKLFVAADADNDNKLSLPEFLVFRIPRRHPDTKQIVIDDALDNYDVNKDGLIDIKEFLKESDHEPDDEEFINTEKERFTDELDTDSDGFLTGDEIFQWIDPDNREDANDEADHLMSECDANNDNKLSSEEILDNHNIWVESDATDYGRHLLMNHDEF